MTKHIIFSGHYGNPKLHLEEDILQETKLGYLIAKYSNSSPANHYQQESRLENSKPNTLFITNRNPVDYIHPNIKKFINKWGEDYLNQVK